jgi:hypothetical protein
MKPSIIESKAKRIFAALNAEIQMQTGKPNFEKDTDSAPTCWGRGS